MRLNSLTAADVAEWSDPTRTTILSKDDATVAFQMLGPRVRFLKTLPVAATVLDAGAGDGSLIIFKTWPFPARPDLRMFAWAGEKGENFDKFEEWEVGYWPTNPPDFGRAKFDAIMCSNFLEHIDEWPAFVELISKKLKRNGKLYLEWPRLESVDLPTKAELMEVNVDVATGCYHDDATHKNTPPLLDDVLEVLKTNGLIVSERGVVRVPMVDQELAVYARRDNDSVGMTLAYWSMSGWCQYLVASRL